ncbi:UvrD-helicase domain-containing protein [Geomicrobium sp. JCM 19055]|uniref:UvrD-helicase domain-containing protein n=1 Tax=Geomicrobium sp. JCM 19055 TaxID=1460649 RepID=UPI00351C9FED
MDEFQDSSKHQYYLFLRISEINIICWAIGDVQQSIFRFANKSSKYLIDLLSIKKFKQYTMNINYRCHASIDLYGRKLLGYDVEPIKDSRIYKIGIDGNETDIGLWFERNIKQMISNFGVNKNSEIGILSKKDLTLELFLEKVNLPHKIFKKNDFGRSPITL